MEFVLGERGEGEGSVCGESVGGGWACCESGESVFGGDRVRSKWWKKIGWMTEELGVDVLSNLVWLRRMSAIAATTNVSGRQCLGELEDLEATIRDFHDCVGGSQQITSSADRHAAPLHRPCVARFNNFDFGETDSTKYDVVLAKFETQFSGLKRSVFSRYELWQYTKRADTPFVQYLNTLQNLARPCSFVETDEMIRDKIVFSAYHTLKEALLKKNDLTLEENVRICQSHELTTK
ncbi:hypothetical protein CAPTEDRAFT_192835 [Capitella teleta]|uniref:Uncharacterized protein n=1 Tax=Capitella teleta TaxID=283909 RepID=R7VLI6_CAPTE|nr:hypothetical protein CAPTEDRAFT_192835 [Capitella teleta]|eukprot:ELU17645.1 hypothetical protein CAPTEDRAFT_192835 [Capitella teleta]